MDFCPKASPMRTNRKTRRIRLFSIAIIIYMLAAFTWWALLLRKKTIKYHNLQIELVESKPLDPEEKRLQLEKIEHELSLQNRMILGEAIFFWTQPFHWVMVRLPFLPTGNTGFQKPDQFPTGHHPRIENAHRIHQPDSGDPYQA